MIQCYRIQSQNTPLANPRRIFWSTSQARRKAQQSDRADIRERLINFVTEGRELLAQIKDAKRELPAKAADEWALRAETYLRDRLGERYVPRFRKDANDLYGDDAAVAADRLAYWRAVRDRVVNLDAISAEFLERPGQRP